MNGVGAPDRRGSGLGKTQVAYLPPLDQSRHRANGVLDGRVRIDPVLVVEIDHIDAEPAEARVAGLHDVLRAAVDAGKGAAGAPQISELGGEHHAVPPPAERPADQLLVASDAVRVRSVEERDAQIQRAMNRRDRLLVVASRIYVGHPHAAEAERRNAKSGPTERPRKKWHSRSS